MCVVASSRMSCSGVIGFSSTCLGSLDSISSEIFSDMSRLVVSVSQFELLTPVLVSVSIPWSLGQYPPLALVVLYRGFDRGFPFLDLVVVPDLVVM